VVKAWLLFIPKKHIKTIRALIQTPKPHITGIFRKCIRAWIFFKKWPIPEPFRKTDQNPMCIESLTQYLKDYGSNRFSFVREIAERVVEQNNQLIQKLESLIGEGVPF
jgi:hypothetical protein